MIHARVQMSDEKEKPRSGSRRLRVVRRKVERVSNTAALLRGSMPLLSMTLIVATSLAVV
jgi:hypothetical protein